MRRGNEETTFVLDQPVDIALIGTGNRAQTIYKPLFEALQPWVRLTAVCDPVSEHARAFGESMGVPAFTSLHELTRARPMEAAIVVTPIDSHHAISCHLSSSGIHNLVETTMASLLVQARQMEAAAERSNVVMRIAENFFRFPFDRIAKKIDENGFIGPVKRLTCYHDHLGYHNNSRWIVFFGGYPDSVRSIEHTMETAPHYERPHRYHEDETFRARFFTFPENRLVTDMAGNIKGMLGRYPRPGYTEIDGSRGTIVREAVHSRPWYGEAEVRYCSDEALRNGGVADQVYPVVHVSEEGNWKSTYVDLPGGRVEHINPHQPTQTEIRLREHYGRDFYGACVMDHIVDFARAIRGDAPSEYSAEDAEMAMMMEVGARESALQGGNIVKLPLQGELEAEDQVRQSLMGKYGVDPLDVDAMLAVSYPKP
jgi:predicted dehydrogenase